MVCTALSMAGGFITDLKIGYWLGSTPAKQETWKFLGTIVSAATVGGVMIILNKTCLLYTSNDWRLYLRSHFRFRSGNDTRNGYDLYANGIRILFRIYGCCPRTASFILQTQPDKYLRLSRETHRDT